MDTEDEIRQGSAPVPDDGQEQPIALAAVMDTLEAVVFQTDAEGRWTYLNLAWTRLTGFSVPETLGRNFLEFVHPDEREHTIGLFMAVIAGGATVCHHQGRYLTSDGSYRWVELRASPVLDGAGVLIANTGTLLDLTERRLAQDALAEHAELLELSYDAEHDELPVSVVAYTDDLLVSRSSPVLRRALGHVVDRGHSLDELLASLVARGRGASLGGPWGLVATARRTSRAQHGDLNVVGVHGRSLAFHVSAIPLTTTPGSQDPAFTLVFQDVTALRRGESRQAALSTLSQSGLIGVARTELLEQTARLVVDALEVTHCAVLEYAGEEGLFARAATGWPGGARRIGVVPAYPTLELLVAALNSQHPVSIEDLRADPGSEAHAWLTEDAEDAETGAAGEGSPVPASASAVAIPGAADEDPFGVLLVRCAPGRALTPDDLTFLHAVAGVLASALARQRAEEATRHQALHDPLTGLANRALLHDRLDQALRAQRREGGRVALLVLDLDRFKEVNDTLGHDVGDDILRTVGTRLSESTREADTVVRLGGDEFAVVMPAMSSVEDVIAVAQKIRARVSDLVHHRGLPLRVEASVGVVLAPEHGSDSVVLLKRADVAMYRAKNLDSGVAVYSYTTDRNRPEHLAYAAALRGGIEDQQLVVHYQPKLFLASGRTSGVEALVRWAHPTLGLVLPGEFIAIAERTGLIKSLTWNVLDQALLQARVWRESGHAVPVAVNLSARMLHDPGLVPGVLEALERAGVECGDLMLEVTETAVMASPASSMAAVTELRDAGVRLSVDDFGTGYSSLAYLRDLPVHQLKIDRSFTRNVVTRRDDASIVRSVIELGHNLEMDVVAEGVESAEACALLLQMGCDEGQGFYLGRPMPADQLLA